MGYNAIYVVLLFALSLFSAAVAGFTPSFDFGNKKVQGVNLGGWLVLEPWITPSLFDHLDPSIVDELTFSKNQDRQLATDALIHHWDTWITEADFKNISDAGLNHVRIPVGYWAFEHLDSEPYIQGQFPYLNKSITWAENHGLKVIINLHGAPGSQNGFDNSGQLTSNPYWSRDQSNVDVTRKVIQQLISMYYNNPVVSAISVLNEPLPYPTPDPGKMLDTLTQFYYDSYGDIRYPDQYTESNTAVIYSDAFQGLEYWRKKEFMAVDKQGVIMDTHKYQMFTYPEVRMNDKEHIKAACEQRTELAQSKLWAIVGEWTPAATDCAPHLNGRNKGSRFDGTFDADQKSARSCSGLTGDAVNFSDAYKKFLANYWEAQASTYENATAGWIAWTWKTERAHEWSYQAGLDHGWIKKVEYKPATAYEDEKVFPNPMACERLLASAPRGRVVSLLGLVVVFCIQGLLW